MIPDVSEYLFNIFRCVAVLFLILTYPISDLAVRACGGTLKHVLICYISIVGFAGMYVFAIYLSLTL